MQPKTQPKPHLLEARSCGLKVYFLTSLEAACKQNWSHHPIAGDYVFRQRNVDIHDVILNKAHIKKTHWKGGKAYSRLSEFSYYSLTSESELRKKTQERNLPSEFVS